MKTFVFINNHSDFHRLHMISPCVTVMLIVRMRFLLVRRNHRVTAGVHCDRAVFLDFLKVRSSFFFKRRNYRMKKSVPQPLQNFLIDLMTTGLHLFYH